MKPLKKTLLATTLIALLICAFSLITSAATYGDLTYTVSNGKVKITDCDTLATSVTIPSKIDGYPVTSIGDYAFSSCISLTSIEIPDSVTSIGDSAFISCDSLASVTIGNGVTSIGGSVFVWCESLTSIEIPDSVTSIGELAFEYCTSLESVTIPDSVTSIGDYAFSDCTSLASVEIPNSVTSIGNSAFSDCTSLASVTIPDSVTSIGYAAFEKCTSLESVTIGNSVTSIGDYAFYRCDSLASVTIGNGVTSIGSHAFDSCESLKTVYYTGSEEDWNCITFGSYNDLLHNAEIIFNYVAPHEYTVNSITIKDISGQALTEIPDGKFMATVSFTCNVSNSNVMVVLAKYTEDGKYDGLIYVSVEDAPVGSTLKITLPVDNSDGTLTKLKAFLWDSFELFKPVADSVCFPA